MCLMFLQRVGPQVQNFVLTECAWTLGSAARNSKTPPWSSLPLKFQVIVLLYLSPCFDSHRAFTALSSSDAAMNELM